MAIQKAVMYKILAVVLALSILIGCSERVEAAEESEDILYGTFEYEGVDYTYFYSDYFKVDFGSNYLLYEFSEPVYAFNYVYNGKLQFYVLCNNQFHVLANNCYSDGSIWYVHMDGYASEKIVGDKTVYVLDTSSSYGTVYPFVNDVSGFRYVGDNPFLYYFTGDNFDDLKFQPKWNDLDGIDALFEINNLQAEIQDDSIVVTWEPQLYLPYRIMQHMYIRFGYATRSPGTVTFGRNKYIDIDKYAKMSDCSITIPLSDLTLLGDRYVSSLLATPYYYVGDNLDNKTRKGQGTVVYFDEQGVSSAPIIVDPEVTDEIPQEDVEMNIFQSIQNFFSGFFRNLMNTIKSAVVPESEDVLALLQEMNDWFSVRFGFIWYPFDLAIDIVGAFALGEADSKFTVPAFTINILGGIKLWDSFEADLDPIGFLQYVRFFTSTIMCCGTVSLAIRKWDEWIGGEH